MTNETRTKSEYGGIDMLRFVAAISVLLYHFTSAAQSRHFIAIGFPEISAVTSWGFWGVPLFFMISGFAITLTMQGRDATSFAIARLVRLFPCYWICCSLTFIVLNIIPHKDMVRSSADLSYFEIYIANMTLLEFVFPIPSIDRVYWTLGVEFCFYFWVAVFLLLRRPQLYAWFLLVWLALAGLAHFFRLYGASSILGLGWVGYFIAGAAIYLCTRPGPSRISFILLWCSFCLCWATLGKTTGPFLRISTETSIIGSYEQELIGRLLLIASFAALWLAGRRSERVARSGTLVNLGMLSYPLYLLHGAIGTSLLSRALTEDNRYAVLLAVIVGFCGLSICVHRYLEAPILSATRKLVGNHVPRQFAPFRAWVRGRA